MRQYVIGLSAIVALAASGALAHSMTNAPAPPPAPPTMSMAAGLAGTGLSDQLPVQLNAWETARNPVGMPISNRAECDTGCIEQNNAWNAQCQEDFGGSSGYANCIWMGEMTLQGCFWNCFAQYGP